MRDEAHLQGASSGAQASAIREQRWPSCVDPAHRGPVTCDAGFTSESIKGADRGLAVIGECVERLEDEELRRIAQRATTVSPINESKAP